MYSGKQALRLEKYKASDLGGLDKELKERKGSGKYDSKRTPYNIELVNYTGPTLASSTFDYLYSIKGKEATFVFDQEQEDGNDAVVLKFIVRYDLMDLITVDYLVRGEYWEQSMRDCYEPMLIKNAQLYLQSNSIDSVDKKDEDTEA